MLSRYFYVNKKTKTIRKVDTYGLEHLKDKISMFLNLSTAF